MRFPRVKAEGQSFYHRVSRVVDRQFIFQAAGHGSPWEVGPLLNPTSTSSSTSWVTNVGALPALGCTDTLWVFRYLRVRTIG